MQNKKLLRETSDFCEKKKNHENEKNATAGCQKEYMYKVSWHLVQQIRRNRRTNKHVKERTDFT